MACSLLVGYSVKLVAIAALYIHMYLENNRRDREAGIESGVIARMELRRACW